MARIIHSSRYLRHEICYRTRLLALLCNQDDCDKDYDLSGEVGHLSESLLICRLPHSATLLVFQGIIAVGTLFIER